MKTKTHETKEHEQNNKHNTPYIRRKKMSGVVVAEQKRE
jgi:hypothetical protein